MTAFPRMRRLFAGAGFVVALAAAPAAHAVLLNYTFSGVAGGGSSLTTSAGVVNLSGAAFTAYGQTISDTDLFNGGVVGDGVGFFAATTTYDFGPLGLFTTNAGADFYGQNCQGATAVDCILLSDVAATAGWRLDMAAAVAGDPDFGIAVGSQLAAGFQINTRTQSNAAGDSLTIATGGQIISADVTAQGIPEPASLTIVGLALGVAGAVARRRREADQA